MAAKAPFGLSAALTTPFDASGRVDRAKIVAHAAHCLTQGCTSITLFGTTGEGSSVGADERGVILTALRAGGVAPEQIVYALADTSIDEAAAHARAAIDFGCRNVLLPPTFYFKNLSDDGLYDWYAGVFSALGSAGRDVILYNIPSVTAVTLPLSVILRLTAAFPATVTGVKDSGGDWAYSQALLEARGTLAVMIGDERHLAHGMRLGAEGAISGMANILAQRLITHTIAGRDDPAMVEMVEGVLRHPVTPAVKSLVAHVTGDDGWRRTRPPLLPTPADAAATLAALHDRVFPVA